MPNTCENYEKKCGGCPLLTLPYPEQVAKKQARVSTLLGHYAPVEPLRAMQEPWHYRNKAIATFAMQPQRPSAMRKAAPSRSFACSRFTITPRPHTKKRVSSFSGEMNDLKGWRVASVF